MRDIASIGFYTLSDERAKTAGSASRLSRCELVLSSRCNFKCPYCRSVGGPDIPLSTAKDVVNAWADEGLQNIRFSGGEPTLYAGLVDLVRLSISRGVARVAVSTNGSAPRLLYQELLDAGVSDFSVSLDACCAEDSGRMTGRENEHWGTVVENIKFLAGRTYVTVGVVLTPENASKVESIILFADELGVSDIRVIPAAQNGQFLPELAISPELLARYPILRYRAENLRAGVLVRGNPHPKCGLVLDDMAVMGAKHYPCIIYMREGGHPVGEVGSSMREDRLSWYKDRDCTQDPICAKNCLDVCVEYNRKFAEYGGEARC